jgi:hypothetical protein
MNKNNTGYTYTIIILVLLVFFIIFIIEVYSKFSKPDIADQEMGMYDVQESVHGNGKNMNQCLQGCVRGVCNRNKNGNNNNSCKYDFQCQYCNDKNTNQFYVDFNDERRIIPLYEEQNKLTNEQDNALNKSIYKNNQYINMLNHKIEIMNS